MQTLVQSSLDFMRGVALQEPVQALDIDALLDSLIEDVRDMGHDILLSGHAHSPYPCRALALKRCLSNLIANAVRYGKAVQVIVEDGPQRLRIRVIDSGPGLPDELLEKVFEPFFRAEPSRNAQTGGTGLGLSIARNIARGHGGDLVLQHAPSHGLEAVLTLPR